MGKIKLLELFGGIGACSSALDRIGVDYEVVDYVEIDKYAVKSYNAIHNTNFEPQDIISWDKDLEVDLIMTGSPCQDFSNAGKGAGGDKGSGTRSSLMYETLRIVEKLKPKYVIWENVKNLLSKKHKHNFDAYIQAMEELGYINKYQVLNAKDYGIPQNRERVFTVSIRTDLNQDFEFPQKQELKRRLKDMLEDDVDEKYYLSDKQIERIKTTSYTTGQRRIQKKEYCDTLCARDWKDPKCVQVAQLPFYSYDSDGRVYSPSGIHPTLRAKQPNNKIDENDVLLQGNEPTCVASRGRYNDNGEIEQRLEERKDGLTNTITSVQKDNMIKQSLRRNEGVRIKNNTKKGYLEAHPGGGVYTNTTTKRGTVQKESIATLTTIQDKGVVMNDLRIRKLTPKECWRLMGFTDEEFEKAQQGSSNSQLYKQAGNSIVVDVIQEILKGIDLKEF